MNKVSDPNIHHGRSALRRPPKSCEARFRHLVVICGRSELQRIRAELATLGLSYEASWRSDMVKLFKKNWQSILNNSIHNTPCWRSSCQWTNVPAKGSHKRLETEILICSNHACICLTQRANPGLTKTGEKLHLWFVYLSTSIAYIMTPGSQHANVLRTLVSTCQDHGVSEIHTRHFLQIPCPLLTKQALAKSLPLANPIGSSTLARLSATMVLRASLIFLPRIQVLHLRNVDCCLLLLC